MDGRGSHPPVGPIWCGWVVQPPQLLILLRLLGRLLLLISGGWCCWSRRKTVLVDLSFLGTDTGVQQEHRNEDDGIARDGVDDVN